MRRVEFALAFTVALGGCMGTAPDVPILASDLPQQPERLAGRESVAPPVAPSVLTRDVIDRAVSRGIGAFLARVEVRAVVDGGRFVGWRLVSGADLRRWQSAGLDLREGDVVTRVNGQRVERPEHAAAVFRALPGTTALAVEVLRESRVLELRVAVQDLAPSGATTSR